MGCKVADTYQAENCDQFVALDSAASSMLSGRLTKKSNPVQASIWSTATV